MDRHRSFNGSGMKQLSSKAKLLLECHIVYRAQKCKQRKSVRREKFCYGFDSNEHGNVRKTR